MVKHHSGNWERKIGFCNQVCDQELIDSPTRYATSILMLLVLAARVSCRSAAQLCTQGVEASDVQFACDTASIFVIILTS